MRKLLGAIVWAVLAGFVAHGSAPTPPAPARIVSLIPAVTEMLFAIGAGPQIVGVSSFDHYPPEVERITKVGALLDPDLERIISLEPDLVVLFESQTDLRAQLERARIPIYVYTHSGLADITATLTSVGGRVGHDSQAISLARSIDERLDEIRRAVAGRRRPETLIVIEREVAALRGIYASGGVGFIHDMVVAAGGENVFADVRRQSVQATTEVILTRRPNVILELRGGNVDAGAARRDAAVWRTLGAVPAVRSGRVVVIADDRVVVPGPRVAEGTAMIARALHPEAFPERR
jgi:iron complex transport system substrate-binding protein